MRVRDRTEGWAKDKNDRTVDRRVISKDSGLGSRDEAAPT